MFYQEITQEESFKYVNHYFSIYKSKIKQHNIDFHSHYDYDCNFDSSFFERIVFGNEYFLDLFGEYQHKLIKQGITNSQVLNEKNEQYRETVLERFKEDFKEEFAREYISKIDEILKDYKEELRYALDDEKVYQDKEEARKVAVALEEEFSEEERLEYLKDAQERKEIYSEKIQLFEGAKDSVSTILSQAMFI